MIRAYGHRFGHKVYTDEEGRWRYCDTDELIDESEERQCPHCDRFPTEEGHDPCIANLPGVKHACCGHGTKEGYIAFEDGHVVRGDFSRIEVDRKIEQVFDDEASSWQYSNEEGSD